MYWMEHKGEIESRHTAHRQRLSEQAVKDMRDQVICSEYEKLFPKIYLLANPSYG
jgi:predicted glycosyltransferase